MSMLKLFSVRTFEQLSALQVAVRRLAVERNLALRMVLASRGAATSTAQREFWLEFAWMDQEYRMAVRRLANFCAQHRTEMITKNSPDAQRVAMPAAGVTQT